MKADVRPPSVGMFLLSLMVGIMGGFFLAIIAQPSNRVLFLTVAAAGFAISWGLAYITMKG